MPVFAVLADRDNPVLGERITTKFKNNNILMAPGQWLVDANETVKFVSEELNLSAGDMGRVVVFKVDSYFGHHNKDLWDWLELPRSNGA